VYNYTVFYLLMIYNTKIVMITFHIETILFDE
jgi:hypothetical protein